MFSVNPLSSEGNVRACVFFFFFFWFERKISISLYIANITMNLNGLFLSFKIDLKRGIRSESVEQGFQSWEGGREKGKLSGEGSALAQRLNTTRRVSLIRGQGHAEDT